MTQTGNPMDPDFIEEEKGDSGDIESKISAALEKAQADIDKFTKNDREMRKKDTVEVMVNIMSRIKEAGNELNEQTEEERERLYYLTFNATILIFRICSTLRVAGYPKEATHYLAFNVLCLDNNLILTTVKYLDWRVLNYVELGRAYADLTAYKAASKVIEYGLTKVLYTKKIEEQDPPVPDGAKDTLTEALRVLRTQEIKYQLQQGTLTADTWKKKIEETFAVNKYHRSLAIVECLSMNDVANCHLVQRTAKHLKVKQACLKLAVEMLKGDVTLVREALLQIHDKKKRDREKKDKFAKREEEDDLDELLDKYKALEMEMIKEKDWKFASYNVPIEVHVELLKLCYEGEMWAEFDQLLDPALVRLKFRRYEVPYLATVDIQMSATKISNIPNGFEKLPKDLNAANLRIELKKHRASNQKSGGDTEPSANTKTQAKKEEKKVPPPKAEPKKKDAKGKDIPATAAAEVEKFEEEEQEDVIASQKELEFIQHIYVYMLLQRTKNSQNAIVGIDVVLADEDMGPELPDSHFAVAVPIRQHPGAYEKTGLIPYIVFRRTANSLIDEEDQLSIITDVQILQGQDRHLRPPLGYIKIPIDLRQTPEDLERVPNLDYVFLCYKTDKQVALVERDLLIFRRLAELERSLVPRTSPDYKALSEEARFLMTTYDLQHLTELSRTMREALLGPLGDYYIEQRRDILADLSCELYGRYLLPVLQRIDIYVEMRNQKEFFGELVDQLDEHVIRVKNMFVEVFNVIHRIMTRESFVDNIILYSKFSIYYANLLEETGDFRSAVQGLRGALGKLVEWRENRLKSTLCSKDSVTTPMSITVDNKKVGELENKISQVTGSWRELILRKERDRERREAEKDALDEDEGDEEQEEERLVSEELHKKSLFERGIDSGEWHRENDEKTKLVGKRYFSEQDQIVHALHCDLLVCLYRCEVKLGKEMTVVRNQTNGMLTARGMDLAKNAPGNMTKNLSASLSKKMNQPQSSKSLATSKSALKDLQHTLQEAGKLPPAKPQALNYEKILQKENNQNPYQNTLLYMSLAVTKNNAVAQKSLLLEALENLKKAKKAEEEMGQLAVENAVQVSAARHFHSYYGRTPSFEHPYSLLAKAIYIKKTPVPLKPIMLCRTSTSITMKLPFYKPITEYKSWRNISRVALYGKPSGSGVAVSLNNTDYEGTGEKHAQGHIVHVTGLIQNEKYVFAAGGYTPDAICVNGIGETCKDILTLLPLSLHQLSGYLAEISFKLGHYSIAKQAAEAVCTTFVIKNEHRNAMLDARVNPVLAFRLNMEYLQLVSPIEAKQVAEAFIILARVSKIVKNDVQKLAETRELKIDNQKIDMKIANYLVIALDIAMLLNMPVLVKKVVCELFNHLVSFFQMELQTPLLFQITLKLHQALRLVPSELVDATSRRILACLSFQLVRLSLQTNEESMLRRVMLSELPLNSRKWRKYSQFTIQKPELTEEEQKKYDEQQAKIASGEEIPEGELIAHPEEFEEKQYKLEEFEVEGNAFEELLLSLGNYTDVVRAKSQRWKDLLSGAQGQVTNGIEVTDTCKDQLQHIVDFWENLKNESPMAALTKLIAGADKGKRYLEFACKCIRRAMEMPDINLDELAEILENKIQISEEIQEDVIQLLEKRGENLENDRVEKQRRRFELLEEKIQKRLEQKSLGGNFTGVQTKKLQKMTEGGAIDLKDMKSQQMVTFESEEDEALRVYDYLWISERFYLKGICLFLSLAQYLNSPDQNTTGPRMLTHNGEVPLNCVFNDILRLDFTKFQQVLKEHQERVKMDRKDWDSEQQKEKKEREENAAEGDVVDVQEEDEYNYPVDERVHKMASFLEVMANAAMFALNSKSWLQLVSIVNYVWNAVSYDLTSPLDLMHTEGWKDFVIIAECGLYLLEYLQKGGKLRQMAGQSIDNVKNQKTAVKGEGKTVAFKFDEGSEVYDEEAPDDLPVISASAKGPKWYDHVDEFDINVQSSFIGFAMQNLMCVGKWESLVDLANRLNNSSEKLFASQLLPFIIFAQSTLFDIANDLTKSKRMELQDRIQLFENWKLTNKKKRSRQALITGEIPPEEQEFLDDKARIEKEIFRLEVIESVLQGDKDASNKLLEDIKRDANNCDEWLGKCRELYSAYGIATEQLREEEMKKACAGVQHIDNYEIKLRRKSHKVATNIAVQNYKKCIDLLRKRQENFLLIQALHELGNIHYADGNLAEAEVQWNDCVDTIFQQLYVVAQFRTVFKKNPFLADSFGSRQVLIGGIVLTKLAKLCYEGKDLQKFSECVLMAAELFAAPAKLRLPHPQVCIQYAEYSFKEFFNGAVAGEMSVFTDKQILQPNELLLSLHLVARTLLDMDRYDQAIPLASLMEYVAAYVCKSRVLVTKARLTKAMALIDAGYLNEAYQIFRRVVDLRDLPKHGLKESEVSRRGDGANFFFDRETTLYFNDLTPDHDKNQPAIEYLLKPIEPQNLTALKSFCSPGVLEMLQFLRCLFLVRLGECENTTGNEKAGLRDRLLSQAEESARAILRSFQLIDEVHSILGQIKTLKIREINVQKERLKDLDAQLRKTFETAEVPEQEQKGFFIANTEEEMSPGDHRSQSLSFMMRTRALLGRVFRKQGLLINAFYVLRQGLTNFKLLAEGETRGVETGEEAKEKGSFKLPEQFGGLGGAAAAGAPKGGKPAPAKGPDPKDKGKPVGKGKGDGDAGAAEEAKGKREEEERNARLQGEREQMRLAVEADPKRKHPHIFLWLKTKIEIITILFHQKRMEDVQDSIAVTKLECMNIRDQTFTRQLDEIDFMMQVASGERASALFKGRQIMAHAKKYSQVDQSYTEFLGNLSELMYNIDKSEEAAEVIKEGRIIAWYRLRDQGIEIDSANINGKGDVVVDSQRKKIDDGAVSAFANAPPASGKEAKGKPAAAKGKPDPKGGADAKAAADDGAADAAEGESRKPLNFGKPVKYELIPADEEINTSRAAQNIYLHALPLVIRFDIRFAQYCIMIDNKLEMAKKILMDTLKLLQRTLYPSPQLIFYCSHLLGLANLRIFEQQVIQFQSRYGKDRKYRQKLADHIPHDYFALGEYLIELPNFSSQLRKTLKALLNEAKEHYKAAVKVGRNECVLYELDFTLRDALQGLAETHFLLGEYRQRVLTYKYAGWEARDISRRVARRKELMIEQENPTNDDLDEYKIQKELEGEQDKWEEEKESRELLEIHNHRRAAVHYLQGAIAVSDAQVCMNDKQHEIGQTNLTTLDKLPRDVASELFQASQVAKVVTQKLPGFEFKEKTQITSSEVLAFLKSIVNENGFFTFGQESERLSKLITKLHKYLKTSLPPYQAKCVGEGADYAELTNREEIAKQEIIAQATTVSSWTDFQNSKSYMFYVLGPLEADLFEPKKDEGEESKNGASARDTETPAEKAARVAEQHVVHFGMCQADPVMLSKLHQDVRDLADKMQASEKLTEEQNERDRRGYQKDLESLIDRLGGFFKPPILSEEFADQDVNCLSLVKDCLPPLSIENVMKFADILKKESGCTKKDPYFNAVLRKFHRLRYAK